MNIKTAIHRMNVNNNELSKSLSGLKSRYLASIHSDITKNPIEKFQQITMVE
jgi:hypothetical protein